MRKLLHYAPRTGVFTWRVARHGRPHGFMPVGALAGSVYSTGYRVICINGKRYKASRLAVLWMTGRLPRHQVDHKNRNRSDDRWSNLREATPQQNQGNKILHRNNRLGIKGVCWERNRQKYKASIEINGRSKNLGRFNTAVDAQVAYAAAAKKHFGKFARIIP